MKVERLKPLKGGLFFEHYVTLKVRCNQPSLPDAAKLIMEYVAIGEAASREEAANIDYIEFSLPENLEAIIAIKALPK